MSIYFVGDIQGCYYELRALLEQVNFDSAQDQLWIAGDMVARGPDSFKTIQFLMSLGDSAKCVLGNHDLHLLAICAGIKKAKQSDHLDEILNAPNLNELVAWLSRQPLLRKLPNEQTYMSHAGLSPQWQIDEAVEQAQFAEQLLRSPERDKWLALMYGEKPNDWQQVKTKEEKFRYVINAFTRMRFCYLDGALEFDCKTAPVQAPQNIIPWFELCSEQLANRHWIFGHWAMLMGGCPHENIFALDTGCVWGEHLTLLRWSDKKQFIEKFHKK